jgi:uncharacterized membrane protein YfcA
MQSEVTKPMLTFVAFSSFAMVAGTIFGVFLTRFVTQEKFRKAMLTLVLCSGVSLLWNTVGQMISH